MKISIACKSLLTTRKLISFVGLSLKHVGLSIVDFYYGEVTLQSINSPMITLLPKKDNEECDNDFRLMILHMINIYPI